MVRNGKGRKSKNPSKIFYKGKWEKKGNDISKEKKQHLDAWAPKT